MPANSPTRLDALTSLRFFAAAAVVVMHSRDQVGLPADITAGGRVPLYLGVSFFFVLSGFILHHVYPALPTAADRGRFLLARFARVWPGHALALAVMLAVAGLSPVGLYERGELGPWVASLAMANAWVPLDAYNEVGNVPSWSVSTEFGFYLLFPLLVRRFDRTWPGKLLACLLLAAGLVAVCQLGELPYREPAGPTTNGLLYVNPLARVFEFCLGMTAARLSACVGPRLTFGLVRGTLLEVAALALVAANGYFLPDIPEGIRRSTALRADVMIWFTHGSACLSFAALIVVASLERGLVTRLLRLPVFVRLGEISYAVYLLHWPLLIYQCVHRQVFADYPGWVFGLGFAAVLLAAAHLTWVLVEVPARRFLVGLWPKRAAEAAAAAVGRPRRRLMPTPAGVLVAVELVALGLLIYRCEQRPYRVVPEAVAAALEGQSLPGSRGVRLGDRFVLRGAVCEPTHRGLLVRLVWESCRAQPLDLRVAVSLSDGGGRAMRGATYPQDPRGRAVAAGAVWVERVLIPLDRVMYAHHHGLSNLAIGLEPGGPDANGGPTDPPLLVKLF